MARLDLSQLGYARASAAATGRPPCDPADLLKLYVYGCLQQVRSPRRLVAECNRSVEVMWLLGRLATDHKAIAEFRRAQGKALRCQWRRFSNPRGINVTSAHTIVYRAAQAACTACPMKSRCCPNTPSRHIARSLYEKSRDVARKVADTAACKQSRNDRKKLEVLFAHLKRIL